MKGRYSLALAALGLAAFLLFWESLPYFGVVPASFLPPPSVLPDALMREIRAGVWHTSMFLSLRNYLLGLVIGGFLGVSFGVITGIFKPLEHSLSWVVRCGFSPTKDLKTSIAAPSRNIGAAARLPGSRPSSLTSTRPSWPTFLSFRRVATTTLDP